MKKNMRKVPLIQIKSDLYHKKEYTEAEDILKKVENIKFEKIIEKKIDDGKSIEL